MLLDPTCVLCGERGTVVCPTCASGLQGARSRPPPLGLDDLVAVFDYAGARTLVTGLKNRGRRDLVGWWAAAMADRAAPCAGAVVTWAPTGVSRRRSRGYDQAELLARAVARRWHLPCRALLRRSPGPPQSGLSAAQRRRNPAFRAVGTTPPCVVLVDDVVTTGATLTTAARALRAAGTQEVRAVVGARAVAGRPA